LRWLRVDLLEAAMPIPSSLPWMESADAKLARAYEHFETYNTAAAEFVRSVERNIVQKVNSKTGAKWLVFWEADQFPPIRLSAIVGDVVFNLRCALDHIVCGLVRKADQTAECEKLGFPICTTEKAFNDAIKAKRLVGVSVEAVRRIRSVQPFHSPENSRMLHPLWLLHDLNNRDKHRAVHLTFGATHSGEAILLDERDTPIYRVKLPPTTELGPVTVPLPPDLPNVVKTQAHGSFVIVLRGFDVLADRAVHDVLATCIRYVDLHVVTPMKPLFR
jgi:hypothetical protein